MSHESPPSNPPPDGEGPAVQDEDAPPQKRGRLSTLTPASSVPPPAMTSDFPPPPAATPPGVGVTAPSPVRDAEEPDLPRPPDVPEDLDLGGITQDYDPTAPRLRGGLSGYEDELTDVEDRPTLEYVAPTHASVDVTADSRTSVPDGPRGDADAPAGGYDPRARGVFSPAARAARAGDTDAPAGDQDLLNIAATDDTRKTIKRKSRRSLRALAMPDPQPAMSAYDFDDDPATQRSPKKALDVPAAKRKSSVPPAPSEAIQPFRVINIGESVPPSAEAASYRDGVPGERPVTSGVMQAVAPPPSPTVETVALDEDALEVVQERPGQAAPIAPPGEIEVDITDQLRGSDPDLEEIDAIEEVEPAKPKRPPPPPKKRGAAATGELPPPKKSKEEKKKAAPPDSKEKRKKPWWEDLFGDDFLRTMERLDPRHVRKEADFIEESLGVERGAVILDLACGSGEHAVELASRGYSVVGFDLSLASLARAADEAQERGQKLNFLHGDMREMAFESMFDGVYCWSTSFGYFEDEKNVAVLQRVHRALRQGGMFLLDVVNRDYVAPRQPSLVWFEGDGCTCMDDVHVDFFTSRLKVKRMAMFEDGHSRELEYSMRIYALHELGKVLHDCGFKVVEVTGHPAHPGVFFGTESPRMIILAERT